jgi:hypothetical protein
MGLILNLVLSHAPQYVSALVFLLIGPLLALCTTQPPYRKRAFRFARQCVFHAWPLEQYRRAGTLLAVILMVWAQFRW